MACDLIDPEDGENRAVRYFLAFYAHGDGTIGGMRSGLEMAGYPYWPEWVEAAHMGEHLTKLGAQNWLRHLFALEKTLGGSNEQQPKAG